MDETKERKVPSILNASSNNEPDAFRCFLTGKVMKYPVMTVSGNSFEKEAIEKWLQDNDTDPSTGEKLPSKDLIPNHALRNLIDECQEHTLESKSSSSKSSLQIWLEQELRIQSLQYQLQHIQALRLGITPQDTIPILSAPELPTRNFIRAPASESVFFTGYWPSRISMLNQLPPEKEKDKDLLYLVMVNQKIVGHWYESGQYITKEIQEPQQSELRAYFVAGTSIAKGKANYEKIALGSGWIHSFYGNDFSTIPGRSFYHHGARFAELTRYAEALPWLLQSVLQQYYYPPTFMLLMEIYSKRGFGLPKDENKALIFHQLLITQQSWFEHQARCGDAVAQYGLGEFYHRYDIDSDTETENTEKMLYWLQKSAHQENEHALHALGLLYEEGTKVTQDLDKAVNFLRPAMIRSRMATYNLCGLTNRVEEIMLLQDLDTENFPPAVLSIAEKINREQREKKDQKIFIKDVIGRYQTAAHLGFAEAQYRFSKWFYLSADKALSVNNKNFHWNWKAPEKSNPLSQGFYWAMRAAEQGHPESKAFLQSILVTHPEFKEILKPNPEPVLKSASNSFAISSDSGLTSKSPPQESKLQEYLPSGNECLEDALPSSILCPISQQPMRHPRATPVGHSYEKTNITAWFSRNSDKKAPNLYNTDPLTNTKIPIPSRLIPNHNLRRAIAELRLQSLLLADIKQQQARITDLTQDIKLHTTHLRKQIPTKQEEKKNTKTSTTAHASSHTAPITSFSNALSRIKSQIQSLTSPGGPGQFAPHYQQPDRKKSSSGVSSAREFPSSPTFSPQRDLAIPSLEEKNKRSLDSSATTESQQLPKNEKAPHSNCP